VQVRGLIASGGQAFLIIRWRFVGGIGVHCLAASMKIGDIAVAVQPEGALPAPSQSRSVAST
jgi:hypothetical protein